MDYAKSLIKWRNRVATDDDLGDDAEEEWTFVDDDSDPELRRQAEQVPEVMALQAQLQQIRRDERDSKSP